MKRLTPESAYVTELAVKLMKLNPSRYSDIGYGIDFRQAVTDALDLIDTAEAQMHQEKIHHDRPAKR